ncbi:MAG: metallophosphoesterase, partial [Pseudomonadota bacterium]
MKVIRSPRAVWIAFLCLLFAAWAEVSAEAPVQAAMDRIVARLCAALSPDDLMKLDEAAIQPYITPEDRRVLAGEYWCFDVDVPVIVSVMRDVEQPVAPFWLPEAGFKKTDLRVCNEEFQYEVWQKSFDAGRVGLGINGFDKHRPHYFVAV